MVKVSQYYPTTLDIIHLRFHSDNEIMLSTYQKFIGEGNQPYEAKREAAIKAKAYLTSAEDGEESGAGDFMGASEDSRSQGFLSDKNSRSQDSMPGRSLLPGPHLENSKSSASQNGTNGNGKEDNGDDQEEDFCSDEDDEDSGEERGRLKLDNWWRKEKKKIGLESLEITYTVKSSPTEEDDKVVMEVTLGDLTAEGDGENIDTARDQAAMFMLDQLKNILDEEGEEGLRRAIDEEGDEEEEEGETSANRNVVDEAVIGDTDDEGAGSPIQQKTAVHQN